LRYKSDDHLWFSFFHEAAHLLLHGSARSLLMMTPERTAWRQKRMCSRRTS
jgi:hypothetical protein